MIAYGIDGQTRRACRYLRHFLLFPLPGAARSIAIPDMFENERIQYPRHVPTPWPQAPGFGMLLTVDAVMSCCMTT
eukprot:9156105-Alexandrium_andersonii.AAC.1